MKDSFSIDAVAAALRISVETLRREIREGKIMLPDTVRNKRPAWFLEALGSEINKRLPPAQGTVASLNRATEGLKALNRAEQIERCRDAKE